MARAAPRAAPVAPPQPRAPRAPRPLPPALRRRLCLRRHIRRTGRARRRRGSSSSPTLASRARGCARCPAPAPRRATTARRMPRTPRPAMASHRCCRRRERAAPSAVRHCRDISSRRSASPEAEPRCSSSRTPSRTPPPWRALWVTAATPASPHILRGLLFDQVTSRFMSLTSRRSARFGAASRGGSTRQRADGRDGDLARNVHGWHS